MESHDVGPEVKHFTFTVPGVPQLHYEPGQFVSLHGERNGKPITRAYSTASVPRGNQFELCLNRVKEGIFSPFLFELQPGDSVEMSGPLGYFTLRDTGSDSIFVATGTGIAPFRGMLQRFLPERPRQRFTLIFGVRFEAGLLYREEFEELARRYPNFEFQPTLSRSEAAWTGRTGHVQEHVLAAIGERRDLDIYICGLKAMVDDLRARLKSLDFDRKRIIYEKYD